MSRIEGVVAPGETEKDLAYRRFSVNKGAIYVIHGQFTVLKGDSMSSKNEEREVGYLQNTQIFYLTYPLVQNLPVRNDIALLQRDQRQQA